MNFKISEFAKISGVSPDTLRLYEKYGIVNPKKDDYSKYRYFSDKDVRSVLKSRMFRSYEFPLQEVAQLTKTKDLISIIDCFEKKREDIKEEIKRYKRLLCKTEEFINRCQNLEEDAFKCTIKTKPSIYRLIQTKENALLYKDELHNIVKHWMDHLPYTFFSLVMPKEVLLNNNENNHHSWGLAVKEKDIKRLGLKINECAQYYPQYTCVSCIIKEDGEKEFDNKCLCFIMDYIKENNYEIIDDLIGEIIVGVHNQGQITYYLEINIPIKEKNMVSKLIKNELN
ncbi:MerR family transcriptional regulator [Natranaerovirga hydrolytica]|nr:MerR family transcriptional regulator [Natranaerovirga hydrolytica]